MPKTKDGFYKDHQGLLNNEYVLLAGGGHLKIGNAVNNIPLSNNSLNIGLDADKLDGYHANELFQSFTNGENNVTNIKIGDTTLGLAIDADQLDGHHASYFQIATSKSYNSVNAMPSGTEGWYNIFTITDNLIGTCICNIKAYAHSSLTFIVSKGYQANGTLQILQYNSSSNGNYFYVKGVRLLDDGKVQALFNKTSSPTTNINVTINIFSTTGQLVANDILTLETGNPTVIKSLTGTHGKATTDIVGNASTASKWETARTFTLGNTGKLVDGSQDMRWTLEEIGAAPSSIVGPYFVEGNSADNIAGTWTGSHPDIISYFDGLTVIYVPKIAGASTTTLNINNLGATTCYYTGNSQLTTQYSVGTPILLTYTNNGWRRADFGNTDTHLRVFRQTDNSTWDQDYPLLASRHLLSEFSNTNDSYLDIFGLIGVSGKVPTINPITGELKAVKFTGEIDQYETGLFIGDNTNNKATVATTNGNTYIKLFDSDTIRSKYKISGTDIITVSTDGSGNITIGSTGNFSHSHIVTIDSTDYTIPYTGKVTLPNNRKAFYGTCSTVAGTADKVVTLNDTTGWELKAGTIIGVKFTNTNSASSITLNVNNSGAKQVYYNGSQYTSTASWITGEASKTIYYMYNGTQWEWLNTGYNLDTHYTSDLYIGAITTSSSSASDNPYIKLFDNSILRNQYQIKGSDIITVKSDGSGNITIGSTGNFSHTHIVTIDGTDYTIPYTGKVTLPNNRKAFYGTCTTAAGTASKVVTLNDTTGWELKAGTIIGVKYTNTNSASSITLNVNNSGAKQVYYNGSQYTNTASWITGKANKTIYYMYNGTQWEWLNVGYNLDSHYTTHLYIGAASASSSATQDNPYIKLFDNTSLREQYQIKGEGVITVKSDGSGNITIGSTGQYTHTHIVTIDGTDYTIPYTGKVTLPNNRKAFYGTCSTAAGTAAKVVTLNDTTGWELKAGTIVGIKFTNTNSASSITLNVNNSGAKQVYYNGSQYTSTASWITGEASKTIYYMYNGTQWEWLNVGYNLDTHYTSDLYIGPSGNTSISALSNPYIKFYENSSLRHQYQIKGSGSVTVQSDGSGNITISGTDTDTHYASFLRLGAINTTTNAATTNGNTYLKLIENGSVKETQIKIIGSGNVTVTSDANGVLTINGAAQDSSHYITSLIIGDSSNNKSTAATTNGNTYIKLFDDNTIRNKYKISGSDIITVTSDGSGNITIGSTGDFAHTHIITINGTNYTIPYSGSVNIGQYFAYRGSVNTAYVDLSVYTSGATGYQNLESGTYTISRSGYSEMLVEFRGSGSTSALEFKTSYGDTADLFFRKTIDSNRVSGPWRKIITDANIGTLFTQFENIGSQTTRITIGGTTRDLKIDADMTDGLHVHSGRNNEANKIVRTDSNGYIQAGWINTTSGAMGTGFDKIYVSNDSYIRYVTKADFLTGLNLYWANLSIQTVSNPNTVPTFSWATFSRVSDHGVRAGTFRGLVVGSRTGEYIHMYERVHIGSPAGWGSREAPSYGLSTYGGAWLATDTGNVGIGTTSPSAKLHVNGDTILNGNVSIGSNNSSNYITFYGIYGDNPGHWTGHDYIGNRLWGNSEASELLLFKGNDAGNGSNANTVSGAGPDRIRHIAAAHIFQTYTSALSGSFEAVATSSVLKSIFEINTNIINTFVPILQQNNNSWLSPARVQIGRLDTTSYTDRSCIGTTNGNLHIDPYSGKGLYLNYYCPATTYFNGSTYWINTSGQSNMAIAHLLINGTTWWSNWNWSGQSGQPTWVWGSNDGTNMYVWNPRNFTVSNSDMVDGYHAHNFFRYEGWWTSGNGNNVDNAEGMVFVYQNHGSPSGWGVLSTFSYERGSNYKMQLFSNGYTDGYTYYRNKSSNRGGWGNWIRFLDSTNYTEYVDNNIVYQHTSNNVWYPLVWSNQNNTSSVRTSQLYKSYDNLIYNPSRKMIRAYAYQSQGDASDRGICFNDTTWINSIGTNVIFRNNGAIRFGGSGWDWNAWAGLSFDGGTTINIGMPDNICFTANSAKTAGTIRTASSKLEIFPNGNGNYGEGIRIHTASNGWTTLILCGTDNTGFNGTSANSWSLHTNGGNFYLNRNNSSGQNSSRLWGRTSGYTVGNIDWSSYTLEVADVLRVQNGIVLGGYATFGTHYITGAAGRIYFGGNFHIDSIGRSSTQALYLNYYAQTEIHFEQDRLIMDSEGKTRVGNTNVRRAGMYGLYDSTKIGHIWSMGTAYVIANDGSTFGNLYGLAYKHTNNSTGGTMAGGHQMVWCNNGNPRSAMGYNGVWAANIVYANGQASGTAGGLALYSTSDPMTYGIAFRVTSSYGKHGGVQGDWATYITMSDTTNRGWIFRRGSTNVVSIDGTGKVYATDVIVNIGRGTVDNCIPTSGAALANSHSDQATFRTALNNTKSYIGSTRGWNGWQNVISCRHRNGCSNGNAYGMYIRTSLTASTDNLVWDREYSSSWQGERVILDSTNYPNYLDSRYYRQYNTTNVNFNYGTGDLYHGYGTGMSTTTGITGSWMHVFSSGWSDNSNWISQIAVPTADGWASQSMWYRTIQGSNYAWRQLVDSNNWESMLGSQFLRRFNWWTSGNGNIVNNLRGGTTFAYSNHTGAATTGTILALDCANNTNYTFQIQVGYNTNIFYWRSRNGDNGTWLAWLTSAPMTLENSYWGLKEANGGNGWIRTSSNGFIPYQSGGEWAGHSNLGTNSWYFSTVWSTWINAVHFRYTYIANSTSWSTNFDTAVFGSTENNNGKFTVIRTKASAPAQIMDGYSSGIAWKGADTKGLLSVRYYEPTIRFAGGNGTGLSWYMTIAGRSGHWYDLHKLPNWYDSRPANINVMFGDGALRKFVATSSTTTGKPDSALYAGTVNYTGRSTYDAHILHMAWDNTGNWDSELALADSGSAISIRGMNGSGWNPWRTLYHEDMSLIPRSDRTYTLGYIDRGVNANPNNNRLWSDVAFENFHYFHMTKSANSYAKLFTSISMTSAIENGIKLNSSQPISYGLSHLGLLFDPMVQQGWKWASGLADEPGVGNDYFHIGCNATFPSNTLVSNNGRTLYNLNESHWAWAYMKFPGHGLHGRLVICNTGVEVSNYESRAAYFYGGDASGNIDTNPGNYISLKIRGTVAVGSDIRTKKNIRNIDSNELSSLYNWAKTGIKQFDYKEIEENIIDDEELNDNSHKLYGVIAQDLVTVCPQVVINVGQTLNENGEEDYVKGVNYFGLHTKLIASLIQEIEKLRLKVNELENRLN